MAGLSNQESWERIRQGVKDAETLIGQKRYNKSMIKSRQTLEYMVHNLTEKAGIAPSDISSAIEELYETGWISKTTCEHYHKIRMIGNKAVNEDYDNAYDANQAYHLLSQEVYTFADDYKGGKKRSSGSGTGAAKKRTNGSGSRQSHKKGRAKGVDMNMLIRLLMVAGFVVVLVFVIRLMGGSKKEPTVVTSSAPAVTTEAVTQAPTKAPETMPDTIPVPVFKTSTAVNVRSEPSTSGRKLGLLQEGTIVDYVADHDNDWAVIYYNGTKAYVAKQYLVHD